MSSHLEELGFWASFNRPYFGEDRSLTGHSAAQGKYGVLFSYDQSPRGQIFGRLAPAVDSLRDMREVIRRNDFPNEVFLAPKWALRNKV
jgi:hypothetical protein